MNPLIQLKRSTPLFLIILVLACFPVLQRAQAVSPPPDGGYPNQNTAEGKDALFSLTTGRSNTAIGFHALHDNTTGFGNTATGSNALLNNTRGGDNTACGDQALHDNTTGGGNTAVGAQALSSNTTGIQNTALGDLALESNTTGGLNTACGLGALFFNTAGGDNVACGDSAMEFNTTGSFNTAIGTFALSSNDSGTDNTATGFEALGGNTGNNNTGTGAFALVNTTGNNNTAIGHNALVSNTSGNGNIALGASAGAHLTMGDNNIDIGNEGARDESNTIRIGTQGTHTKTFIAGISDAAIGGMEVRVNQNGRLGIEPSSKRFKEAIKPMDNASKAILALKPVTFRYKKEIDAAGISQFGLVAEEVEKVNPDLVARDEQGKPFTVRYDQVNAMLLNEFLKEHRKVEELEANAARQQKQIEALTVGLQKVSAQLDPGPEPQTVVNGD
jgi:hypothetical protein